MNPLRNKIKDQVALKNSNGERGFDELLADLINVAIEHGTPVKKDGLAVQIFNLLINDAISEYADATLKEHMEYVAELNKPWTARLQREEDELVELERSNAQKAWDDSHEEDEEDNPFEGRIVIFANWPNGHFEE